MGYATAPSVTLAGGMTLIRHYDPNAGTVDAQCGPVSWWSAAEQQMIDLPYRDAEGVPLGGLGYFTDRATGRSKFSSKIELHVYSTKLKNTPAWPADFGGADCLAIGSCRSRIRIEYFLEAQWGAYKLPAAFSHEAGHALARWCEVYGGYDLPHGFSEDFRALWEMAVSSNHTLANPQAAPWDQPWGPGSRDEDGDEQAANAARYFFGVGGTRGTSGAENGGSDPVLPGFEDPEAHPEWGKMWRLLPELAAYIRQWGYAKGSLVWIANAANPMEGYFRIYDGRGRYVAQTWENTWFEWTGGAWRQFWPSYNRT